VSFNVKKAYSSLKQITCCEFCNLKMNGPDVAAVCCIHLPQLLVQENKEKSEVRTGNERNRKEIWSYFCFILLNSSHEFLPLRDLYVY